MRYKVGDKVRVRKDLDVFERYYHDDGSESNVVIEEMLELRGQVVKIASIFSGQYDLETLTGKEIQCRWVDGMFELEPVKVECKKKVVVETDGETTTATLYDGETIIKEAKAVCMPEDEFDFELGMNLALDRLFAPEDQQKQFELTE